VLVALFMYPYTFFFLNFQSFVVPFGLKILSYVMPTYDRMEPHLHISTHKPWGNFGDVTLCSQILRNASEDTAASICTVKILRQEVASNLDHLKKVFRAM
jgi:hypothetical protein